MPGYVYRPQFVMVCARAHISTVSIELVHQIEKKIDIYSQYGRSEEAEREKKRKISEPNQVPQSVCARVCVRAGVKDFQFGWVN